MSTSPDPPYNPGPMMTLAALAANAAIERPSGETLRQQTGRILAGINVQLFDKQLATAGEWNAIWLALTQDRANLAYIAQNPSKNSFAVCLRGTSFSSPVDLGEDLNVGQLAQFTAVQRADETEPILVSSGAMKAFAEVANATYGSGEEAFLGGLTLEQAVATLIYNAPASPIVYITGHSLGGALATMVGLYLATRTCEKPSIFSVYTFAAPTAGLQSFADSYDRVLTNNAPNQSWRLYNVWDAIPYAWQDLTSVEKNFYPSPPGPAPNLEVKTLLERLAKSPRNNRYVQPNQANVNVVPLNTAPYGQAGSFYDPKYVDNTLDDFLGQVGYQHNCYLELLGVKTLPGIPPTVHSVMPNNGSSAGGQNVVITGTNFVLAEHTSVDFGTAPAEHKYNSPTQITAIAPAVVGTVDVTVTTRYGTSGVTPLDQYTAPMPAALAPYVAALDPNSGPKSGGTAIVITGGSFTPGCTVFIGGVAATSVVVLSLTEITAVTPGGKLGMADVVVKNSSGQASTQKVQFEYKLV